MQQTRSCTHITGSQVCASCNWLWFCLMALTHWVKYLHCTTAKSRFDYIQLIFFICVMLLQTCFVCILYRNLPDAVFFCFVSVLPAAFNVMNMNNKSMTYSILLFPHCLTQSHILYHAALALYWSSMMFTMSHICRSKIFFLYIAASNTNIQDVLCIVLYTFSPKPDISGIFGNFEISSRI